VTFFFPWGDGNESPYLMERLPSSGFFFVAGDVAIAGSATRLAGTLSGQFSVYETGNAFQPAIAWCPTTSHQFVLSR
jgi:hypothetical protein